ncbi:MAG: efflux RND transporter periplasmic adaptor subunit, partial [Tepidisphaeraceae bacterium]
WIVVPVIKLFRYLTIEPELHRKRGRAWVFCGAVAAAAIIVIGLIRFPVKIDAEGVAEPAQREVIHARTGGFVTKIVARDGQQIGKGDVILISQDDELESQVLKTKATLEAMEIHKRQANVLDQAQRIIDQHRIDSLNQQLATLLRQRDDLTVRAPISGRLIAPKLSDTMGKFIPQGEQIATVAEIDELEVHAVVEQNDAQLAFLELKSDPDGIPAEVRLVGDPGKVLHAKLIQAIPAAQEKLRHPGEGLAGGGNIAIDPMDPRGLTPRVPQFELRVIIANPGLIYQPGQRAYVRLKVAREPLAWQWTRRFLQLLESRKQNKSPLVS